jgi:hypothetical protein
MQEASPMPADDEVTTRLQYAVAEADRVLGEGFAKENRGRNGSLQQKSPLRAQTKWIAITTGVRLLV